MTNGAAAGGAAGAAGYCIIANAIKASGAIVRVEPNAFMDIMEHCEAPLAVYSPAGFFTKHKYLTSYRGLCFFTKTATPLLLPTNTEVIQAKKIWIPD